MVRRRAAVATAQSQHPANMSNIVLTLDAICNAKTHLNAERAGPSDHSALSPAATAAQKYVAVVQDGEGGARADTVPTYTISNCVSNMPSAAATTAVYQSAPAAVALAPQDAETGAAQFDGTPTPQRVYNVVPHAKSQVAPYQIKPVTNNNNGQQRVQAVRPGQKVQILSNVVMHKNVALKNAGMHLQRQLPIPQVPPGKLGNGKTLVGPPKSASKPSPPKPRALKTNLAHRAPKGIKTLPPTSYPPKSPGKPGIKTIPPQYNHYNQLKMLPGQRTGIKTLAPQKPPLHARNAPPQKPNYIGKHAVNVQKVRGGQGSAKGRGGAQRAPPGRASPGKYVPKGANSQSSFNQTLTAQILQSLPKSGVVRGEGYGPIKGYAMQSPTDSTLSDDIGEEIRPEISSNLSYLSQVVMLDHNYGAPPPPTPVSPPSSRPPIVQQAVNGLPGNSVPGQTGYHSYGMAAGAKRNRHNSLSNAQPLPHAPPHAAPPPHSAPQILPAAALDINDDDAGSTISSDAGREVEPEGEETETAPEGEGDDDGITRCICDFDHDDGYMICCDICSSWQHVDCMGLDRAHIPEKYACVRCEPRRVDRQQARLIQQRKREELAASDSSSDTSTASSTGALASHIPDHPHHHLPLNNNLVGTKKRLPPTTPPAVQVPSAARRKAEPRRAVAPPQSVPVANAAKRPQRRDSMRERGERRASLKKREKKTVMKRKMKPRPSLDDDSQDSWPTAPTSGPAATTGNNVGASLLQLRQWIEHYEEAVTNHYSPELRARVSNMRANGSHAAVVATATAISAADVEKLDGTQRCRLLTQPMTSIKIVMSTVTLSPGTPVIELRGKYMLSTQHRGSAASGPNAGAASSGGLLTRQHSQRPGPFLFFYRLPRDSTEVCVDTRTYGNDARFVRRSCKPNAELRHCLEKGTLHLYVVTIAAVEKNTELTIKHESHDLAAAATTNVACACGNPSQCGLFVNQRKNGGTTETPDITLRKRRGRRTSEPSHEPLPSPPESLPTPPTPAPPPPAVVTRRTSHTRSEPPVPPPMPAEKETVIVAPPVGQTTPPAPEVKEKDKKRKLTREERKMEAIVKAFERMEKAEQRKQEVQARQVQQRQQRRESEPSPGGTRHESGEDNKARRRKRKGRSRTVSVNSQSSRKRTRLNSTDSYMTSGDEGSLLSPPLPASIDAMESRAHGERNDVESPIKDLGDISEPAGVTTAAGLLLALANGAHHEQNLNKSPTRETDGNSSSSSIQSSPSTPLSSACLLVAAAVGPLEPGFKFPKTKKAIMNEWLNKSPEPLQPASSISPMSMQPHLAQSPQDHGADFYANKSLATLVQAASLCDSPPQGRSHGGASGGGQGAGNAKKRWLRQAISEECDSPCSRPESPPCLEMVAPPKKRRLARESLSSEQSFTPPTTPTMLVPPSNPLTEEDYPNNDEEFYTADERRSTDNSPDGDDSGSPGFTKSRLTLGLAEETEKLPKEQGGVEIVYGEHDGELSPPHAELEPEAVLKERVVQMQLEFGGAQVKSVDIMDGIGTLHPAPETFPPACVPSVPEFSESLLVPGHGILDPRLGRDRPLFRDSAQLLGTVEKTIKFYEENFVPAAPPLVSPVVPEEKEKVPEIVTPAKRKLSISEYRQRKQLTTDRGPNEETNSPESPRAPRPRSDSASSSSSPLSSDDEAPPLAPVPSDMVPVPAFNSEPTTVERQRENVDRLKKAFGLTVDDETRKNALSREVNASPKSPVPVSPAKSEPPKPEPLKSEDFLLEMESSQFSKTPIDDETETDPEDGGALSDSVLSNYIPPFNNPVYPNSTQFTSFSAVDDPYEGRNPSPPPSDILTSRLGYGQAAPVGSPESSFK